VNKTILVTRPDPAGSALCKKIDAEGYKAIHLPTIKFAFPKDGEVLRKTVALLGEQDWIIFVSPQAVLTCVPLLRDAWPIMPENVKMAAIGAGTATVLSVAGYQAIFPENEWTAEGLLKLPAFFDIAYKRIAIVRGEGGREVIEDELIARKAQVSSVIIYRRVMPDVDMTRYIQLLKDKQIDIVTSTSCTGVENLKKMVGDSAWPYLQKVPLIVVSERIKKVAHDLGFESIHLASNASDASILKTIKGIHHE
jgi:uroporphyrinogen-III synthase